MDESTVIRDYLRAASSGLLLVSLPILIQLCKPLHRAYAVVGIMTTAFMVSVTFLQWGHRDSFVGNVACFITIVFNIGMSFKTVLGLTDDQRARIMALFTPTVVRWGIGIGVIGVPLVVWYLNRYL